MGTQKNYQEVLGNILAKEGLAHRYSSAASFREFGNPHEYLSHQIVGVVRPYLKIFGVEVPFTRQVVVVANFVSEPSVAKDSDSDASRLKYDGLKVGLVNPAYSDSVKRICNNLEAELKDSVTLIC